MDEQQWTGVATEAELADNQAQMDQLRQALQPIVWPTPPTDPSGDAA